MGFIGKGDTGDPSNYNMAADTTGTNYTFAADTVTTTGASFTIPTLYYCGHCPRRFSEEQDYEFHII